MNDGTVNIHGKEYKTVALRIEEFRQAHPDWTINTVLVEADERIVVMRGEVIDADGRLIASGYAEENRTSSSINRTSALENCETSAVGRALAFFGLAGSEIASADEVANAIHHQGSGDSIQRNPKGRGYSRTQLIERIMTHVNKMPEEAQDQWKIKLGDASSNEALMTLGAEAKAMAERLTEPVVY